MKHLGTSSSRAEASRGGTCSRRPGTYPHRAGVTMRAEPSSCLETSLGLRAGGFSQSLELEPNENARKDRRNRELNQQGCERRKIGRRAQVFASGVQRSQRSLRCEVRGIITRPAAAVAGLSQPLSDTDLSSLRPRSWARRDCAAAGRFPSAACDARTNRLSGAIPRGTKRQTTQPRSALNLMEAA